MVGRPTLSMIPQGSNLLARGSVLWCDIFASSPRRPAPPYRHPERESMLYIHWENRLSSIFGNTIIYVNGQSETYLCKVPYL